MSEDLNIMEDTLENQFDCDDLAEILSLQFQRDSRRYAVDFKDFEEG